MAKQEVVISVSKKRKYKQVVTGLMSARVAASDLDAPPHILGALAICNQWAIDCFNEAIDPAGNPSEG